MAIMWRENESNNTLEKVVRPGLVANVGQNALDHKFFAIIFTGPELKGVKEMVHGFPNPQAAMAWADSYLRQL